MEIYKYLILPQKQLMNLKTAYWLKFNIFTVPWWLILFFLIAPWIVWIKKVDKKRIDEILLHGFFVLFFCCLLDNIGYQLNLWSYGYIFIPVSSIFEPYDFSVLPVLYMLIYQYCSTWKSFITVQFILAAFISIIIEPITVHFNIYIMINWKYEYSFLIYPLLAILCKLFSEKLKKIKAYKSSSAS